MYESNLKVTLGILIGVVITSTLFILIQTDDGFKIYQKCLNDGAYVFEDKKRIITCEVK